MTRDPGANHRVGDREDLVPVSVRLGNVVPPEDPEDWTRPLTWAAAIGILASPAASVIWFWLFPPATANGPVPGTWIVAATLAAGATLTGATQIGALRASTATLGAALLGALFVIISAASFGGEGDAGNASPAVSQAVAAALAGLAGALSSAGLAAALARIPSRAARIVGPGLMAVAVSALVVPLLFLA